MTEATTPTSDPPRVDAGAGSLLRRWRIVRRLSQLELSLQADVSARHLSYVETGRSQPSREMVLRLADVLDIPLRERNALLLAAGYAPHYYETGLAAPEMAQMQNAVRLILEHQEPYPAFLMDRYWNIRMMNDAAARCGRYLIGDELAEPNMVRRILRPDGLRPVMTNWEETARDLIRHLHQQVAWSPSDETARALLSEVLAYPGVPPRWADRDFGSSTTPLLTTGFRKGDVELRFFSTITTFGTPHDVTLEELRIECSFPADEATAGACEALFSGNESFK